MLVMVTTTRLQESKCQVELARHQATPLSLVHNTKKLFKFRVVGFYNSLGYRFCRYSVADVRNRKHSQASRPRPRWCRTSCQTRPETVFSDWLSQEDFPCSNPWQDQTCFGQTHSWWIVRRKCFKMKFSAVDEDAFFVKLKLCQDTKQSVEHHNHS